MAMLQRTLKSVPRSSSKCSQKEECGSGAGPKEEGSFVPDIGHLVGRVSVIAIACLCGVFIKMRRRDFNHLFLTIARFFEFSNSFAKITGKFR